MKDWLQKRIDYWEDVVEKDRENGNHVLDALDLEFHNALDLEFHKGILQGFYESMEYLDGQRK